MKYLILSVLFLSSGVANAAMWDSLNNVCYSVTYTAGCGGPPGCASTTTYPNATSQSACAAVLASTPLTGGTNTPKPRAIYKQVK